LRAHLSRLPGGHGPGVRPAAVVSRCPHPAPLAPGVPPRARAHAGVAAGVGQYLEPAGLVTLRGGLLLPGLSAAGRAPRPARASTAVRAAGRPVGGAAAGARGLAAAGPARGAGARRLLGADRQLRAPAAPARVPARGHARAALRAHPGAAGAGARRAAGRGRRRRAGAGPTRGSAPALPARAPRPPRPALRGADLWPGLPARPAERAAVPP